MKQQIALSDPEQLRTLGSAVGSEIISSLRALGPQPASQIARHLKRPAPGVTYHLKRMVRLGLVVETGPRGKHGVLYEAAAKRFVVDYSKENREELIRASHESAIRLFRLSQEEYANAVATAGDKLLSSLSFSRLKGSLADADRKRLWELLEQIGNLVGADSADDSSPQVVITISVVPVEI